MNLVELQIYQDVLKNTSRTVSATDLDSKHNFIRNRRGLPTGGKNIRNRKYKNNKKISN